MDKKNKILVVLLVISMLFNVWGIYLINQANSLIDDALDVATGYKTLWDNYCYSMDLDPESSTTLEILDIIKNHPYDNTDN